MAELDLLHASTTRQIIGAFFYVYNTLGHGFTESVYRRALSHVLARTGMTVTHEQAVAVWFEGIAVGNFRLDLVINGQVIVETKAAERVHPAHEAQLLNYLRASGMAVGLLLNFGPRAEHRRLVLTPGSARYATGCRSSG